MSDNLQNPQKMKATIKNILISDDHPIVRQGVEMMLSERTEDAKFYYARTLAETFEILNRESIDLLFLDLYFPDGNSIEIIDQFQSRYPELKVVVLSGMDADIFAPPVLRAGAYGYINKLSSPDVLEGAIDQILEGEPFFSKELLRQFEQNKIINPLDSLSERELEVLRLLSEGGGNLEMCNALSLQKSTVSTYLKRIKEKLNVEHAAQMIKLFETYRHTISVK